MIGAKEGSIPIYTLQNDSFILWENPLLEFQKKTKVEGFTFLYNLSNELDSESQNYQLTHISPMTNLVVSGADLGLVPRGLIHFSDVKKVLSEDDLRLITILGNLLLPTTAIDRDTPLYENQVTTHHELAIYELWNSKTVFVRVTDENLIPLCNTLKTRIQLRFNDALKEIQRNSSIQFFRDSTLELPHDIEALDTAMIHYYPIVIPDEVDTTKFKRTYLQIPMDFLYFYEDCIISSNAIGLRYQDAKHTVECYVPKEEFLARMPGWERFLIEQLL